MASSHESVADLVEHIAKALVAKPEEVDVHLEDERRETVVELTVDPDDLGRIIGKRGRTAKSMRSLLYAASEKADQRYTLEILE